jgi:hypothetical protein
MSGGSCQREREIRWKYDRNSPRKRGEREIGWKYGINRPRKRGEIEIQ